MPKFEKVVTSSTDEFIACIRANQEGTLSREPLAIEYVWGEDTTIPNTFHFYEKYVGRAGFEAHQQTEHFAAWALCAPASVSATQQRPQGPHPQSATYPYPGDELCLCVDVLQP